MDAGTSCGADSMYPLWRRQLSIICKKDDSKMGRTPAQEPVLVSLRNRSSKFWVTPSNLNASVDAVKFYLLQLSCLNLMEIAPEKRAWNCFGLTNINSYYVFWKWNIVFVVFRWPFTNPFDTNPTIAWKNGWPICCVWNRLLFSRF